MNEIVEILNRLQDIQHESMCTCHDPKTRYCLTHWAQDIWHKLDDAERESRAIFKLVGIKQAKEKKKK